MSDLAKAFAGMKRPQEPESLSTPAPKNPTTHGPKLVPLPSQGTAKSTDLEYRAVKIFIRDETHKIARRKWEDAAGGDFSDLVEMLLQKYLGA